MEHSLFLTTWLPILIVWITIFARYRRKKKIKTLIKNRMEGVNPMEEIIKKFMGIPVTVLCIENDLTVPEGIITSYSDGWITLKSLNKDEETAINCNYIVSVKPKKIKEKKAKNK